MSNSEAGHSPLAVYGGGQGVMGVVLVAAKSRHTVAIARVLIGMVAGQLYLWLSRVKYRICAAFV